MRNHSHGKNKAVGKCWKMSKFDSRIIYVNLIKFVLKVSKMTLDRFEMYTKKWHGFSNCWSSCLLYNLIRFVCASPFFVSSFSHIRLVRLLSTFAICRKLKRIILHVMWPACSFVVFACNTFENNNRKWNTQNDALLKLHRINSTIASKTHIIRTHCQPNAKRKKRLCRIPPTITSTINNFNLFVPQNMM